MPFAPDVFRHCPGLEGRIQDPETSRFRDMEARIAELDAQIRVDGGDPDWRIPDDMREATRHALLDGRGGEDLWVFGYGSLIWDPAIHAAEFRRARLAGFRRAFCLHLEGGRGSPDAPGLMAALDADPGHACEGVAMRLPAAIADEETRIMWMREMIAGTYHPAIVPLETPQGPVEAIAFLADARHERYVGDLSQRERASRIAVAEGRLGTNREYLENLLDSLHALGIDDPEMTELLRMVREAAGEAPVA
ncbi:cation transport protein ChaC [Albimonas donghaensis]|uniref:glutathione-specific gamma-glutamylcyclotransferase n=1 Tax=Albimonas donghaensis TaxID=356660 RepID=A0A1H2TH72_9RHOB|nr:gamma-glutamylcyclotransferase [Albimonas donghaensis]SDW43188.1 cation transport protein ChaC [Albimonas donghaensis]